MSFKELLEGKCAEAAREGRKLRVLDVGVGSGAQWKRFLAKHPEMDWHGTALSRKYVVPSLRGKVVYSTARTLHRKFEPSSFDVIVSNYGIHSQAASAVENVHWLLKPGGEAILTTNIGWSAEKVFTGNLNPFFEVLGRSPRHSQPAYGIHLRKR